MINDPINSVDLAIVRWSAWAPGTGDLSPHSEKPDMSFVPAMLRRRLSSLSRMAFHVAAQCLDGGPVPDFYVFCSRYGEYERSFGILSGLAQQEEVSPAAFSHSVHNTSASLFSIDRDDPTPYTALAAGPATLESAYLEAWSILRCQEARRVLLLYHDEPLPPLYGRQPSNVTQDCALAMVLQSFESGLEVDRLQLSWRETSGESPQPLEVNDPALRVLRLLTNGGEPITNDTGRIAWRWAKNADVG